MKKEEFLDRRIWKKARVKPFDAKFGYSSKKFDLLDLYGKYFVFMEFESEIESHQFAAVSKQLANLGYRSPKICDMADRFLIVEYLEGKVFSELNWYDLRIAMPSALDLLIDLHSKFDPSTETIPLFDYRYSDTLYSRWDDLFPVWGMTSILKDNNLRWSDIYNDVDDSESMMPPKRVMDEWRYAWFDLHLQAEKVNPTLMLFDYHSPNLLYSDNLEGIRRVGLTDFQDAMIGPITYDVVSLIQDARIRVHRRFQDNLLSHYLKNADIKDEDEFLASYFIMGARRNIRNVGSWYRFRELHGKDYVEEHAPLNWFYLETCLDHDSLEPVRHLIEPFMDLAYKPVFSTVEEV